MKISINVDCSPAEARAFLGLPDVSPVNEAIVAAMVERSKENIESLSDPQVFWARAMAAGGTGMDAMQSMFSSMMQQQEKPEKP